MNSLYHKAIELKYKGSTYREISKTLGGKISEGVLKKLFSTDGSLYIPYLEYEGKMSQWIESESRAQYKRMAGYLAKVESDLLQKALKKGDLRLAFDITKDILDRAGVTAYEKTKFSSQSSSGRIYTTEDYKADCLRFGFDPETGNRIGTTNN